MLTRDNSITAPTSPETAAAPAPARVAWIDVARGLGMLLVIAGHAMPKAVPPLLEARKWVYSFHIPLFFLLTGLLTKGDVRDIPWTRFVSKAARSLLLPYLLFGAITFVVWAVVLRHFENDAKAHISLIFPLNGLLRGTFDAGLRIIDAPLWFFPCLFCTLLLQRSLPRGFLVEFATVLVLFCTGAWILNVSPERLPWGLDNACLMLLFVYAGQKLRPWLLSLSPAGQWKCLLAVPVLVAVQTCCASWNQQVDLAVGRMGDPTLFLLAAFSGSLATIFIAFVLTGNLTERVLGAFIGRNTLIIFPLHLLCFSVVAAATLFVPAFRHVLFLSRIGTVAIYTAFACLGFVVIIPVVRIFFPWLTPAPKARPDQSDARPKPMSPERKTIDLNLLAAGLGIALVVLGHSDPVRPTDVAALSAIHPGYAVFHSVIKWVYTFHMPLFFFLSGLNYVRYTVRKEPGFGTFIGSKTTRLLVPFVVFTTIAFPVKAALSHFALRSERLTFGDYVDGLLVPWHNPVIFFWFLPTLFLIFCAAPGMLRFLRTGALAVLMSALTVALYLWLPEKDEGPLRWLNLAGALHSLVFFYGGMLYQRYNVDRAVTPAFILASFVSGVIYYFAPPAARPAESLLLAVLGILGTLGVASLWRRHPPTLSLLGTYSFQIYLFSWFPQVAVRVGLGQILRLPVMPVVVAMFVVGLLTPILAAKILDAFVPNRLRFTYGR